MARPNGAAGGRFDGAGFEVPFAASFEGEALSESEMSDEAESQTHFAESRFEAGLEQGEFVLLNNESEQEGEGEFVLLGQESEPGAEEGLLPGDEWPVLTRILWPALGFPAVVTPGSDPKREPSLEVDATRCVTILVLTNTPKLPANEVAKRLRIVPWSERARRFIADGKPGSLSAADLVVRTDAPATRLTLAQPQDATEQLIAFGEGAGRRNTIIVNLARRVREIYKGWGLEYLHEIRLSEAATARIGAGQYHVFFNNLTTKENAPSDEMALLIRLGQQRRQAELNPRLPKTFPDPLEEYQYEYGSIHKPYSTARTTKRRAEVLHPIFIRPAPPRLRLGHVTDLHVDVRHDVYQHNLARAQKEGTIGPHSFNNWNDSVSQVYADAKRDADGVLMTGDLVDYGRGHAGIDFAAGLGANGSYHRDRNWLLFYDILAAENRYTVPVYTNLGNHDWRINPYPPFAIAGAPGPGTLINDSDCFDKTKLKGLLQHAHGAGHQLEYSYDPKWASPDLVDVIKLLVHGLKQKVTLEKKGLPTETNIDSVLWYLLTINPFLDYLWALPSTHRLLMLDWSEDEGILFKKIENGVQEDYSITPSGLKNAAEAGPRAIRCLTSSQKRMVEHFVKLKSPAKIIGMHVPPIGPWPDWGDDDLKNGFKQYRKHPPRGPRNYAVKRNNKVVALNGHPIFAVPPKKGPKGRLLGMDADYNSFMRDREWFIRALAAPGAGVRLVLSGHIHRNGRFGIRIGTKSDGAIVEGELLLRSLDHKEVQGAKVPAVSTSTAGVLAPLYVNTTSAGPRGNNYPTEGKHLNVDPGFARIELMANGVISVLSFRRPVNAAKPSCDVGKARDKKGLPAFAF